MKLRIERFERKDEWYCPKCNPHASMKKGLYDVEVLGTNICPDCGNEMLHPKTNTKYVCDACGYGKN